MHIFYTLFNIAFSEETWMLSGYVWILPEGLAGGEWMQVHSQQWFDSLI